ncbi:hypothetical protein Baya_6310 [Bagarius yarrelli]|uniref:Uncharacterized protein n=1 Tax=Bagarius yarrelli TaxID=175774 RepID=A0A556TXL5_BAGYA|nr:hypothetical protein Baya_6310 [Bagarius yarrelli]
MALTEVFFVLSGACVVFVWLVRVIIILAPKLCWPIPGDFFTSMGKWAEVKLNRKVMIIPADFTKDDIYGSVWQKIQGLDIAVLGLLDLQMTLDVELYV